MRAICAGFIYGALALGANSALAGGFERLEVHAAPKAPAVTTFVTIDGAPMDLSAYAGDVVVLNFWATWCGPCKREMPGLDRLQQTMGDDGIEVVTIAFGRHNPMAMEKFWKRANIQSLPLHRDPTTELAQAFGVKGLPHTIILDAQGYEIASLSGEAQWDSPEAITLLESFLAD